MVNDLIESLSEILTHNVQYPSYFVGWHVSALRLETNTCYLPDIPEFWTSEQSICDEISLQIFLLNSILFNAKADGNILREILEMTKTYSELGMKFMGVLYRFIYLLASWAFWNYFHVFTFQIGFIKSPVNGIYRKQNFLDFLLFIALQAKQ